MSDVSGKQQQPQQQQQQQQEKENDWTFEHIRTLVTWLNYSNVNMFLIDLSIKYYRTIITNIMAYTLLLSTISSTISISQLGISKDNQPLLYNVIQYSFIGASTFSTLLIGYMRLFKIQETLDTNTLLYKSWLSFSTRISSEFQMPVHMRTSALVLLQDMKNEYIDLFCKNPDIPIYVKLLANNYFQRNLTTMASYRSNKWYICRSRPNYIKRTNVFFIFQDIIKNEIKRLSAELTPINYEEADDDDHYVPSYYDGAETYKPKSTYKNTRFSSRAIIEYKYDGPFIVIDVRDKDESITFKGDRKRANEGAAAATIANYKAATAAFSAAAVAAAAGSSNYSENIPELTAAAELVEVAGDEMGKMAAHIAASTGLTFTSPRAKRKTLLNRFRRSSDEIGDNRQRSESPPLPSHRERQMSFTLPERCLIEQSQSRSTHNKTYSDILETMRKTKNEIQLSEDEKREKIARIAAAAAAAARKYSISSPSSGSSTATASDINPNSSQRESSSISSVHQADEF